MGKDSVSASTAGGLTFIEQLHAVSVQLCPNEKVPYLTGLSKNKMIALRGSCGLWSCSVCGARNGRQWLARILDGMRILPHRNWYFITITAHEKARGAVKSLDNLRQGWKKLYNRMRRKYGVSDYIKVWEQHKDESFHLHVLIARKIGKRWLKDNSRQCGMGYQVDSSRSKNGGQVAGYVAKYLLKGYEGANNFPKGLRRIEASRTFPKLPDLTDKNDYEWIINFTRTEQDKAIKRNKEDRVLRDLRPTVNQVENAIILDGHDMLDATNTSIKDK